MSERFHRCRYGKKVWLTDQAIASMAKRQVTLAEVKTLVERGEYRAKDGSNLSILKRFIALRDHLVCAAVAVRDAIIVRTLTVRWTHREPKQ